MKDVSHERLQATVVLIRQKIRIHPEKREEIILEAMELLGIFPGEPLFSLLKEELLKAI